VRSAIETALTVDDGHQLEPDWGSWPVIASGVGDGRPDARTDSRRVVGTSVCIATRDRRTDRVLRQTPPEKRRHRLHTDTLLATAADRPRHPSIEKSGRVRNIRCAQHSSGRNPGLTARHAFPMWKFSSPRSTAELNERKIHRPRFGRRRRTEFSTRLELRPTCKGEKNRSETLAGVVLSEFVMNHFSSTVRPESLVPQIAVPQNPVV